VAEPRLRALIADDEPLARGWVRRQLAKDDGIEIVGEVGSGLATVAAIQELAPDLLFLDVQMPGVDGFGVLGMLRDVRVPAVVFVTAYDRYAVRAFEVDAVDYLVKPFSRERFAEALRKVKERLRARAEPERKRVPDRALPWILAKAGGKSVFVKTREIDWIEAARNLVLLHVGDRELPLRTSMRELEESLDPAMFLRIHRSTIVNIDRVREMEPWFNGEYRVVLKNGKELTLSPSYRSALAPFRRLLRS